MSISALAPPASYDPNHLLDALKELLRLDSDTALSEVLEVPQPVISRIRHQGYPVGASILIRMHDVSSLSVQELRVLMGDRRKRYRISFDAGYVPPPPPEKSISRESGVQLVYIYAGIALVCGFIVYKFLA